MGKDFEIVAYRGEALPPSELAALIAKWTPHADFFRRSAAASILPGLSCIAFYESVGSREEDEPAEPKAAAPTKAAAPSYFPEGELEALKKTLGGRTPSLSEVMQAALKMARGSSAPAAARAPVTRAPIIESDGPALVRELSRLRGDAFLVGYGDHSLTGIYAHYRDGELVDPQATGAIYAEHDEYIEWVSKKWSEALGMSVELEWVEAVCFPDKSEPPLYALGRPERAIPFDGNRYRMGLAESM